jgi:thiamine-phosphate pyrophosphorylase
MSEAWTRRRERLQAARLMVLVGEPRGEASPEVVAREVLAGGGRIIQLRMKGATKRGVVEVARRIRDGTGAADGLLIINDDADVAVAADADGVHVGQEDLPAEDARRVVGPGRLVGVSTHSAAEAGAAARARADYAGIGTVYASATKADLRAGGTEVLAAALPALGAIPGYAIGGITRERVAEVLAAGVHGIAVGSAIVAAPDIAAETAAFLAAIESYRLPAR